jgi:predicted lipoprotein
MAHARHPERRFVLKLLAWAFAIALALYLFPPFHIRSLQPAGVPVAAAPGAVDVPRFAEKFWNETLASTAAPRVEVHSVIAALNESPARAAEKFGHRAGIGGKAFFLVSGEGRVTQVDRRGVWLSVEGESTPRLVLITGPVFGNALRDVTGLIDITDFSSFDFNALGTELNRLAETRAQPGLRSAGQPGATLSFVAAGEIDDASGERPVLRLVPISVATKR